MFIMANNYNSLTPFFKLIKNFNHFPLRIKIEICIRFIKDVKVYNIFGQLDSPIFSDVPSCPKQSHEAEGGVHEEPRERPDELSQPAGRSHHGIFSKA